MTVYTPRELQTLLGVGKQTAYRIMQEYGFRTGYTDRSPLRITEPQLLRYTEGREQCREVDISNSTNGIPK